MEIQFAGAAYYVEPRRRSHPTARFSMDSLSTLCPLLNKESFAHGSRLVNQENLKRTDDAPLVMNRGAFWFCGVASTAGFRGTICAWARLWNGRGRTARSRRRISGARFRVRRGYGGAL